MSAPRQHRLPAALIGGFGVDGGENSLRDRTVWVRRRKAQGPRGAVARSLNYERGIFDTEVASWLVADEIWDNYEPWVPAAVNSLVASPGALVPAEHILFVMIPLLAGMLVRTVIFDRWFQAMNPHLRGDELAKETNRARAQLIIPTGSRLLRSCWLLARPADGARFILNDAGYARSHVWEGQRVLLFPLRPDLCLWVRPGTSMQRPSLWRHNSDGTRSAWIHRLSANAPVEMVRVLNEMVRREAVREIYGYAREDVDAHKEYDRDVQAPAAFGGWFLQGAGIRDRPDDPYWVDEMSYYADHPELFDGGEVTPWDPNGGRPPSLLRFSPRRPT